MSFLCKYTSMGETTKCKWITQPWKIRHFDHTIVANHNFPIINHQLLVHMLYVWCSAQWCGAVWCCAVLHGMVPCAHCKAGPQHTLYNSPTLNQTRGPTMRFSYLQSKTGIWGILRIPIPKYPQKDNVAAAITATPLYSVIETKVKVT